MTVVNPKSISGINSITTGSGSDNLLTIHTNNGTERLRIDSTGATKIVTGIVTTLTATTGIVTTLTANTVTSLGAVSGTTGTFSGAVSGTTGTFSGALSGTTGTFTGDVSIPDTIVHTGDTNTKIRFPASDIISFENGAGGETARFSATNQFSVGTTADVTGVSVAIGGSMRFVNATGQSATITALPSGTYNTGISGGSAIVFHRISDGGGGSDEIAFETHHQGTRHGEAARFNKSGNLVFPSGQGVDFSATANSGGSMSSELLDDYEEGTWTPTMTYSGGGSATLSEALGHYTKIGRMVNVLLTTTCSAQGGGSGNVEINGLPFQSGSTSGFRTNGFMTYATGFNAINSIPVLYYGGSGTVLELLQFNSTGASDAINNVTRNNITSSTTIRANITYYVD